MTSRAWALPILNSLRDGVPGRQAPLLNATGASRTAFAQSMEHLIGLGLVERNPGYGHPLRPEFRLTELGRSAAVLAHRIRLVSQQDDQALLRRSWTLPILASLHQPRHFNEIRQTLPSITDRALSHSLKELEDRHWLHGRLSRPRARPGQSTAPSIRAMRSAGSPPVKSVFPRADERRNARKATSYPARASNSFTANPPRTAENR